MDMSCFALRLKGINPFEEISPEAVNEFLASTTILLKQVIFQPMVLSYDAVKFDVINELVSTAHDDAAMALGKAGLFSFSSNILSYKTCYADDAFYFLSDERIDPIERISFLEYIIRASEHINPQGFNEAHSRISELLLRQSIQLTFRDSRFNPTDGVTLNDEVHDPFWSLVEESKWDNVRIDMQQALSLRDSGGPNPALYSARSLESAVKIISEDYGWTTGRERGAANYIDTLISSKNGRFIEPWEGDMLKQFFSNVRNPGAHGAGSDPQPKLNSVQTNWAIEFCMISIKSLLLRL
ncbi:MAG: hypothetical protein JKY50_00920 [Oleispira sp.]|nr:hypothetical protein [Oleispira sp.]